ncbi:MAG TPA: PEP/pyruvate-binding domain-containing protein [Caldisericia bacterium]|nr:PEP/pyruvate-binding domain-containing protein [Caldisericia bacterium]HPF49604.1 PEP/pyruvate-binding domain-containing protein [Caldisericia bacterium]HPI84480.1 PEP/pyruvate-binding domain-containing protein [Caldisericia bacterium]HPQ93846.1 PEP/pyruvate-binding domain-containing protein [Caldisericia bacterium]HRV75391.1 PEP/pyruvate-binding domain-containing protein [Caldisericia bacterium]
MKKEKNGAIVERPEWSVILATILATNQTLYKRVCRKLLYYLYRIGFDGAKDLIAQFNLARESLTSDNAGENRPTPRSDHLALAKIRSKTIRIASRHLDDKTFSKILMEWLREDKTGFLASSLESPAVPLNEVASNLDRYFKLPKAERYLPHEQYISLRVSLIQRFLSDSLSFVKVAKDFVTVKDFHDLLPKMIGQPSGVGKTGGKGAGIFIAHRIIEAAKQDYPILDNVRVPNTWYLLSDCILDFIHHNTLEEIITFKYREVDELRQEYQYFEQVFKHSHFSVDIQARLLNVLEDISDKPMIVRSSSLLEDSFDASFAGKYKSLFIANKGDVNERLSSLTDAIAEVYASILNPDAIQYRRERGLIHFREEMGCLIQEVVGKQIGRYFFPAFAGVAFSNNEIRWSRRIKRDDGVVRLVAGLGTRAVDRVDTDYPTLASPGQPGLRVNTIPDEIIKYSQKYIDVIDTESGQLKP